MAHDDEELDWGEDDGWTADQAVAAMDVDRPADSIPTNGDGGDGQAPLKRDDHSHTPQKVGISQEQKGETPSAGPTTRNGDVEKKSSRRTVSRSSSDFGKSLPPGLPQRPATSAPHVGRSDPLAASAMAPSPGKATNGLPPDWEERKSRSNGSVYYFNTKTEETTWTKPAALVSGTIAEPIRPDSPTTTRRERDRRRPTSPNVPSTLPPPPFSLPARPAFNSAQQRRERSASPPPRARSRERQKEPDRDARGGRGERRASGPQARLSPPPRMRDVPMRDPSPEPPRRYRSPSPGTARERGKAGGNRIYNDRARSPPPLARGQRPPSPPRRDDRAPRRPEDRYAPPRTRSRSPGPPRRRSLSPPPMRRARTPPRPRDLRRPSPPPSSSLPQKRRGDTPPPPPARSTIYTDRFDGPRDHDGPEDLQAKRRRVDNDRDAYDGQIDRRDERFGPRSAEEGRRMADDPPPPKRPALPPQDQKFRTVAVKPTRHRSPRRRTPSPPPPSATSDARPPSVANSNSNKRDVPTSERPREGQGRRREAERIKLPETSAAVAAAYSNRRRVISTKDEEPSVLNSDAAGSRDGAASKLPPSGPGGRVPRTYGPALRDGPPRPKSPETLTGKEPPRGPRASHRSPNVSLRPLSPRRDQSPPRQRSPRREGSPPRRDLSPPRRPRSPSAAQQPYGSHRPSDRDPSTMDYEMNTRSSDPQLRRRDSKREPDRIERGQFGEAEKIGEAYPSRVQSPAERPHSGLAPKRDRGGRGRNRRPSPPPPNMRVWGQSQNKRSPNDLDENELPIRDEDRNRYGEGPGRSRAPNGDDAPFLGPRYDIDRDLNEFSEGPRHEDNPRSIPPRQPYPQSHRAPFDGTQEAEQDARSAGRGERTYELYQLRDRMELDEEEPRPNSARYNRDDGQSTRSGRSLEDDFGQRPDPLPEARRLSIQERDDGRFRAEAFQGNRRSNFDTGLEPARENGIPGHRLVRGEPPSPKRYPEELPPQVRRARSSSPGSSSRPNERPQPPPLSRTLSEAPAGQKDIMVSSSRSEDLGATGQTQPRSPPSSKQIGNEDRAIDSDDKGRRDTTTGRVRILRRDLSPIATNGLSAAREPASTQPTPISLDSTRDSIEDPGGPSSAGQASSGKGSLLARLSVPGASSSGDRSKGKRDQPGPSPTGGSSASLQARLENGERPAIGRRDTDDGERRRKKGRRGRGGHGGGRNRDTQV